LPRTAEIVLRASAEQAEWFCYSKTGIILLAGRKKAACRQANRFFASLFSVLAMQVRYWTLPALRDSSCGRPLPLSRSARCSCRAGNSALLSSGMRYCS